MRVESSEGTKWIRLPVEEKSIFTRLGWCKISIQRGLGENPKPRKMKVKTEQQRTNKMLSFGVSKKSFRLRCCVWFMRETSQLARYNTIFSYFSCHVIPVQCTFLVPFFVFGCHFPFCALSMPPRAVNYSSEMTTTTTTGTNLLLGQRRWLEYLYARVYVFACVYFYVRSPPRTR